MVTSILTCAVCRAEKSGKVRMTKKNSGHFSYVTPFFGISYDVFDNEQPVIVYCEKCARVRNDSTTQKVWNYV